MTVKECIEEAARIRKEEKENFKKECYNCFFYVTSEDDGDGLCLESDLDECCMRKEHDLKLPEKKVCDDWTSEEGEWMGCRCTIDLKTCEFNRNGECHCHCEPCSDCPRLSRRLQIQQRRGII